MNLVFPGEEHLITTHRGWGIWSLAFTSGVLNHGGLPENQRLAQALLCIWRYSRTTYITFGCCLLNHVYIHSFRSMIEATEKFPGGGGIWSPGMDLWWTMMGHLNSFSASGGENLNKIFQKFKCPGGCQGEGTFKLWFDWYIGKRRLKILPFYFTCIYAWTIALALTFI